MKTTLGTTGVATDAISIAKVDMKLEVVTIPVSDVDRATAFYCRLGWRQDVTPPRSGIVQFTPPASGCSIQFGRDRTSATPGSAEGLYLIVSDVVAARESLVAADVEVSEVFHLGADDPVGGPAEERHSYGSFVSMSDPDGNRWLLQEVTARLPGREWMPAPSAVITFGLPGRYLGCMP